MITITAQGAATLKVKGTNIALSSVVARLEFYAPKEGKRLQVSPYYYADQTAYENGSDLLAVEGIEGFVYSAKYYDLALGTDPETYDPQTIQVAHDKLKADLEALGYSVVISGL